MSLRDEPESWPVESSQIGFAGKVISVRSDHLADGGTGFDRDVVVHPGAVAVVALDDAGRVLVLTQYRHPVQMRLVEFPAGLLDVEGEEPLLAAQRELAEEGHIRAGHWEPLLDVRTSAGMSSEVVHLFLATGVTPLDEQEFVAEHEEAVMERHWIGLDDLVAAVLRGEVSNALTVAGSLAVWARDHENRRHSGV